MAEGSAGLGEGMMRTTTEQRWTEQPFGVPALGRDPVRSERGPEAGTALPAGANILTLPRGTALPLSPEILREAIDHLPLAVLVVHANGTIATCNSAAQTILRKADGLMLSGPSLASSRPSETKSLHERIAAVAAGRMGAENSAYTILTVSRPSGLAPFILLLTSLRDAVGTEQVGEPMALILVGDLEWPIPDHARQLRLAFDLTEAEAEVAMALMEGAEPKEIARQRGVQVSTIRTQIKMIFAKTGATRQSDPVKLIARLPSLSQR